MGKISSKHAVCKRTAPEGECFLVNTKVASVKDLMDAINSRGSLSEAFVELSGNKRLQDEVVGQERRLIELTTTDDLMSCCGKSDSNGLFDPHLFNIPLTVTLPPLTKETDLLKLLTVDRCSKEGGGGGGGRRSSIDGGIQTDTTDNNHGGSDKAEQHSQDNECGVATVEENGGLQEWHFTLYDFDDLGHITKEDIAGLLKSLYDTVGSVITLQQQGTRVLKLHLTVSPDQGVKHPPTSATIDNSCIKDNKLDNSAAFRSVTVGALSSSKKPSHPTKCTMVNHGSPHGMPMHHKTMPDRRPPVLSSTRDKRPDATLSSDRKDINDLLLTRRLSFCGGESIIDAAAAASAGSTPAAKVRRRQQQQRHQCGTSKRLSEFDEKQLAHLIQQNMSLNDQHHQQHSRRTRRRHSIFVNKSPPQANTEEDPCSADRVCTNNAPADDDANEESSAECRNYYLDLAGIENYTTSQSHDLVSSARPGCGISRAEKGTKAQRPARCKTKLPSSSSAVNNFEYCNSSRTDAHGTDAICEENETITANVFMTARQESSHFRLSPLNPTFPVAQSNPAANDLETVSSSHYHRRHRHREKNQNRAMKQVAEWIEKEHIYQKTEKRVVVVQRHEHHHVHEHFHHHFHHCSHT